MKINFKPISIISLVGTLFTPVVAEPYMNLEMNRIYPQGSYITTQYEMQVGYRQIKDESSWYATVGPVITDLQFSEGLETELGGFLGGNIVVNGDITLYGEVFGSTDETVIVKSGAILSF